MVPVSKPLVSVSDPNRWFFSGFLWFFTVLNLRFFAVPAWFQGFPTVFHGSDLKLSGTDGSDTVSVRIFLNLSRTTIQKSTVSVWVNSHGFSSEPCTGGYGISFNRRFGKPWAGLPPSHNNCHFWCWYGF